MDSYGVDGDIYMDGLLDKEEEVGLDEAYNEDDSDGVDGSLTVETVSDIDFEDGVDGSLTVGTVSEDGVDGSLTVGTVSEDGVDGSLTVETVSDVDFEDNNGGT